MALYDEYGKDLYKLDSEPIKLPTEVDPDSISNGSILSSLAQSVGTLQNGKFDFTNTEEGYILGIDNGVAKFYIGDTTNYLNWDGSTLTISGSVSIGAGGTIGGFDVGADYIRDVANSFGLSSTVTGGDDVRFWAGDTYANRATAPFRVTEAGSVTASNISITGGSVGASVVVALGALNVAARGWSQTCVFSITDADTIAWGSGTFTSADGTAYSISGSNTGNMSAKTYIYLDTAVSTTAYQTTTTAATAVGAGKVLIATAQNATGEATYQVLSGQGGQNIDASSIVANSITANELSTSITYAGSIIIASAGLIRSGQTDYDTGTGWWLGNASGTPKFSIGIGGSATNSLTWNGTTLTVNGRTFGADPLFGDGSDGDVTISGDTTLTSDMYYNSLTVDATFTLNTGGYRVFVKNTLTNNGTIKRTPNNGSVGGNGGNATAGSGLNGGGSGSAGTGGAGGSALASGTIYGSLAGTNGAAGGAGPSGTQAGSGGGAGSPGGTSNNSGNGTNGTGGNTGTSQTAALGASGVVGVAGVANLVGKAGGNGGAGNGGANAGGGTGTIGTAGSGGTAGTAGTVTAAVSKPAQATQAVELFQTSSSGTAILRGSAAAGGAGGTSTGSASTGGGGGGGGSTNLGGNGGGGGGTGGGGGSGGAGTPGGIVMIAAKTIVNSATGTISAPGGNGGNGGTGGNGGAGAVGAAAPVGNGGGGGGGGGGNGGSGGTGGNGGNGGIVVLLYQSLTNSGTINAPAGSAGSAGSAGTGGSKGTGGAGDGTGATGSNGTDGTSGNAGNAGSAGTAGTVYQLNLS